MGVAIPLLRHVFSDNPFKLYLVNQIHILHISVRRVCKNSQQEGSGQLIPGFSLVGKMPSREHQERIKNT